MRSPSPRNILLLISICLVFVGGLMARLIQTDFGDVEVRDIRFTDSNGATLSALLYRPDGASDANPVPGVLAVHGYINSRETQSAYAIELARRGYVVLALDQRGHGYSDPPAFADGFGGPAALEYLRSLGFVDPEQILLSGHSMGGWTVLSAAVSMPDDYAAVIVSGSSTGTFGVPAGDGNFPRNFGLVFGKYDEFSATMWQSPTGAGIVNTDKLKSQFDTPERVVPGQLYGSLANGTARRLYQPTQTHPANHITHSGVAPVLEWAQLTVPPPVNLPPDNQRWQWKEAGTLLSLLGGILFIFALGNALLQQRPFTVLCQPPAAAGGIANNSWWLAAAIFVAIPALSYFYFQGLAANLGTTAWLGQNLTNGFMVWAVGNGIISLILLCCWYFLLGGRQGGANLDNLGLSRASGDTPRAISLSLLLACLVVAGLYLLLLLYDWIFLADFRFWVVALKLMNFLQFCLFLGYLVPFTLFFLIAGVLLHGQLRGKNNEGILVTMVRSAILMGLGILLLLLVQYVPLLGGGTLTFSSQALLTIVAMQFVVLLPITGLISGFFFHRTGGVYTGAFVNGLFITWLIVAGQATHFAY